ncbi:MAG: radical SAM protein [bacterium]
MMEVKEQDTFPLALSRGEIYYYLQSRLPRDHEALLAKVDAMREESNLDQVVAGGVIVISTVCVRSCVYCSFRAQEESERFRLARSEIMSAAQNAREAGIKWIVLRGGDDPGLTADLAAELVNELESRFDFHVSLALGEKEEGTYAYWKEKGLKSYWLRHETCDPHIYRRIMPAMYWVDRLRTLENIKAKGLALASGILVGLPNQSYEVLVDDLVLLSNSRTFALDIEPYRPPEHVPGHDVISRPENQIIIPDSRTMEKIIALARILNPDNLIALSNVHVKHYQALSENRLFRAGANAVFFDFTPADFKKIEGMSPFVGYAADNEDVGSVKSALSDMGLELAFKKPL